METWQSLGTVWARFEGQFTPLDLGGRGGKISFRIAPFSRNARGSITFGLYSGTRGNEGYAGSVVKPVTDYERYETFDIPPQLPNPLFGIRLNQDSSPLPTQVSWILCEDCGGDSEGSERDAVDLRSLILPPQFCQLIEAPEILRPTTLKKVGGEYWVFNFSAPVTRLNQSFEVIGTTGPTVARPRPDNASIDRVWDALIDEPEDLIYFCCFSRNVVRAFRLSSMTTVPQHVADIPKTKPGATSWSSSSAATPFESGYVRTVTGAALLPNGHLAIASRQGVGGSSLSSVGAILEYTPAGDYVQTLVSFSDGGGLLQGADYRDWFGKLRLQEGRLWAVSFRQKMAVSFQLSLEAGAITAVTESSRKFLKPAGLPKNAAWTPHGLQIIGDELLTTNNAVQGQSPGLFRGLYSTDLVTGKVNWSLGILQDCGLPAYGPHPVNFVNPHDFLKVGRIDGKECFLIADFELSRLSLLPIPESYVDGQSFVEIPALAVIAPSEDTEQDGIAFDIESNTLKFPVPRLPVYNN